MDTPKTSVGDGSAGRGAFGYREDREKLGHILGKFLKRFILLHLQKKDFMKYKIYLNLVNAFLDGFPAECQLSMSEIIEVPPVPMAQDFLTRMGFRAVNEVDGFGWTPMCYAALNGDPGLVRALLDHRADANDRTRKQNPLLNAPASLPVLAMAVYFSRNEAAQVLLESGAHLEAFGFPALIFAAAGNNCTFVNIRLPNILFDRIRLNKPDMRRMCGVNG